MNIVKVLGIIISVSYTHLDVYKRQGLNGYTISTGVLSEDLNGTNIIAIPLDSDEKICVGYIYNKYNQDNLFQKVLQSQRGQCVGSNDCYFGSCHNGIGLPAQKYGLFLYHPCNAGK